jgi:hypothetical protein
MIQEKKRNYQLMRKKDTKNDMESLQIQVRQLLDSKRSLESVILTKDICMSELVNCLSAIKGFFSVGTSNAFDINSIAQEWEVLQLKIFNMIEIESALTDLNEKYMKKYILEEECLLCQNQSKQSFRRYAKNYANEISGYPHFLIRWILKSTT